MKTAEQQAALMLVGVRDRLIRSRTQLANAIRGYAAEFGVTAARGTEFEQLEVRIAAIEAKLMAWHRANECSRRLAQIPGVGPITAVQLVMKTPAPELFRSGRQFAAWIGLTPKDHSTAGKIRLGVITRAGDEVLRSTLVAGATSVIQQVRRGRNRNVSPWLIELLKRKSPKLAAVALANKIARIAWKLMLTGESYNRQICALSTTSRAA